MIPIAKPVLGNEEIQAVTEVLKSGMLVEGIVSREFEKEFAEYLGVNFATVTSNGTTALSTVLEAMGIKPGDEVITSPFTFIASANTIAMLGAIPVFVDVKLDTYNIDPEEVRKAISEKTKAIMPVHIFGMPADMPELMEIAEERDLQVLEDACQAHGAAINGKLVGSIGHAATFSFYATKNMITGEGGMITSNDEEIIERSLMIKNHGRGKLGGYSHFRIGYNNRMMDLVSAIGRIQLAKLDEVLKTRRRNAAELDKLLSEYDFVKPQVADSGFESGYHVYAPRLYSNRLNRDDMIQSLKDRGIGSRTVYALPCHKQDTYLNISQWRWADYVDYPDYSKQTFPNSEEIGARHFEIPIHPGVSSQDFETIKSALVEILSKA